MILVASQRGGGADLARHLMKPENEHVELHDLRGFVADDLGGAFKEAHAISKGTRCRQFLFSLSLNPPEQENVPVEAFEDAVERIEAKMGLTGQPRAIVFHEKQGRRHAHAVWSRIDPETMTAINLPHFKRKLMDVARELYLEQNWKMPRGLIDKTERDPLSFSQGEWQQALRAKRDPKALKAMFRQCWAASDSRGAFAAALSERGFYLAKGDRRGHVAVDWQGEVYAISRWTGVKAKEVRARLGDPSDLPSVEDTLAEVRLSLEGKLEDFRSAETARAERQTRDLTLRRTAMVQRHRSDRDALQQQQKKRKTHEAKARAARLPRGLKSLWFRVTGKYRTLVEKNETALADSMARDRVERQQIIERQLKERRRLQHEILEEKHRAEIVMTAMTRDIAATLNGRDLEPQDQKTARRRRRTRSP